MSNAIKELRDYLAKSPSVVYPQDVLEYLPAIEAENAKLRELCADVWHLFTEHGAVNPCDLPVVDAVRDRMRELGVEVDDG